MRSGLALVHELKGLALVHALEGLALPRASHSCMIDLASSRYLRSMIVAALRHADLPKYEIA